VRTGGGRRCTKLPVVYINFELHVWAVAQRINALCAARPECQGLGETLHVWNLRGHNADLTLLRPKLEEQLAKHQFGLIILDPADCMRYLVATKPRILEQRRLRGL
jgi:RecA-family ATPase